MTHRPMYVTIPIEDYEKLAKEYREAEANSTMLPVNGWRKCSENGAPEGYDGQDWVLVRFVEKDTRFHLIPRVAEWKRGSKEWDLIGDVEKGYRRYIQDDCIATHWMPLPEPPKEVSK